jgi:hypothetical protein
MCLRHQGHIRPGEAASPDPEDVRQVARTLALPDAQSVEDLTALLNSAGER